MEEWRGIENWDGKSTFDGWWKMIKTKLLLKASGYVQHHNTSNNNPRTTPLFRSFIKTLQGRISKVQLPLTLTYVGFFKPDFQDREPKKL